MGKSFILIVVWLSVPLFLGFQNCSSGSSSSQEAAQSPFASPNHYFSKTRSATVEVYYEEGAEPFAGRTLRGNHYWGLLETNLAAIFQYRTNSVGLSVPKELADMQKLGLIGKESWTSTDIIALSNSFRQAESTDSEARFYIYFLKGRFNDGQSVRQGTLAVSLTGTPIIAVFKDVIKESGWNPNGVVPKFVEQTTLVHEMGHALGFVNNGVPMAVDHQDREHGAHTTNQDCVMYWLNEGLDDMRAFIERVGVEGDTVLWGPEVLEDARQFSQ